MRKLGARFNKWWVTQWVATTTALAALLIMGLRPSTWFACAVLLFFIPEGIGLIHRGDALPPLTYTIRRYVPRWAVFPTIYAFGAFAAITWWASPHRVLVTVAIAGVVGWLTNHFTVTYEGPGE